MVDDTLSKSCFNKDRRNDKEQSKEDMMELKTYDKRLTLTNGDFQRLVKARKPKGIEEKTAYLVGTGIASLTAACFLIRDAHMEGKKITFLEQMDIPGGSLDGQYMDTRGYVAGAGRISGDCHRLHRRNAGRGAA